MSDVFLVDTGERKEFIDARLFNAHSGAGHYVKITLTAPIIKGFIAICGDGSGDDVTYISLDHVSKIRVDSEDVQYLAQAMGGSKWAY